MQGVPEDDAVLYFPVTCGHSERAESVCSGTPAAGRSSSAGTHRLHESQSVLSWVKGKCKSNNALVLIWNVAAIWSGIPWMGWPPYCKKNARNVFATAQKFQSTCTKRALQGWTGSEKSNDKCSPWVQWKLGLARGKETSLCCIKQETSETAENLQIFLQILVSSCKSSKAWVKCMCSVTQVPWCCSCSVSQILAGTAVELSSYSNMSWQWLWSEKALADKSSIAPVFSDSNRLLSFFSLWC